MKDRIVIAIDRVVQGHLWRSITPGQRKRCFLQNVFEFDYYWYYALELYRDGYDVIRRDGKEYFSDDVPYTIQEIDIIEKFWEEEADKIVLKETGKNRLDAFDEWWENADEKTTIMAQEINPWIIFFDQFDITPAIINTFYKLVELEDESRKEQYMNYIENAKLKLNRKL